MRYETLILDFHGTFTNSDKGRTAHALNQAYRQVLGRNITRDEYLAIMNRNEGAQDSEKISIPNFLDQKINGHLPDHEKQKLIEAYRLGNQYIYVPKHSYLIPQLRRGGATLIILTNGPEREVERALSQWGQRQFISEIYGREQGGKLYGKPEKPHPEVIDFVLSDLRNKGYKPHRGKTLMLGDYKHDIAAGNRAGIHTAFIVIGPNQKPEEYDFRPTYFLLDRASLKPSSEWLRQENLYRISQLPHIVAGLDTETFSSLD